MSNKYHSILFKLDFSSKEVEKLKTMLKDPTLPNMKEVHAAIGRQVAHSLLNNREGDSLSLVTAILQDGEITATHWQTQPMRHKFHEDGFPEYMGSVQADLDDAMKALMPESRPFVIGAIPHNDGSYSFHSQYPITMARTAFILEEES